MKTFRADDLPLPFDEEQPLPHDEEDSPLPEDNTPSDAEQALQEMVGLTRLKEDLREARMLAAFMKRRMELGLDTELDNRHHMLFLGNPGLQERFPLQFYFDDYNADELMEMAHRLLAETQFPTDLRSRQGTVHPDYGNHCPAR